MRLKIRLTSPTGESIVNLSGYRAYTIGRSASDIVVSDHRCSRRHAQIHETKDGQIVLRDIGSTNGFTVNGKKVTEAPLAVGDVIGIGGFRLHVEELEGQGGELPARVVKDAEAEAEAEGTGGTTGKQEVVLNSWPDNLRSLPIDRLKNFVDHIDPKKRMMSVRLADLIRARKGTGK